MKPDRSDGDTGPQRDAQLMSARAWLRVVLYRSAVQFGWFWLACVAWFALWLLPDGRWNRTFDAHAIGTVTRIYSDGADPPDLHIEYVFRDKHGVEHTNYGIDTDEPGPHIEERRELDVAYVSSEPSYSELRVPGVRTRYSSTSFELAILGVFALGGVLPILVDSFRAWREWRRREATTIAERGSGPARADLVSAPAPWCHARWHRDTPHSVLCALTELSSCSISVCRSRWPLA